MSGPPQIRRGRFVVAKLPQEHDIGALKGASTWDYMTKQNGREYLRKVVGASPGRRGERSRHIYGCDVNKTLGPTAVGRGRGGRKEEDQKEIIKKQVDSDSMKNENEKQKRKETKAERGGRKSIDKWDVIAGPMKKRKLNTAKPQHWERRDAQQQQGQGAIANLAHFGSGALENAGRTGMC